MRDLPLNRRATCGRTCWACLVAAAILPCARTTSHASMRAAFAHFVVPVHSATGKACSATYPRGQAFVCRSTLQRAARSSFVPRTCQKQVLGVRMRVQSCEESGDDDNIVKTGIDSFQTGERHNALPASHLQGVPNVPVVMWSKLKSHLLGLVMQHAARKERYREAGRLKDEINSLRTLLMLARTSEISSI
jgi:hypothetical protein